MLFSLFNFLNINKVTNSKDEFQEDLDSAFDIKSEEDDMETISLTSDNDEQIKLKSLDNALAVIMNTSEGTTQLSEIIMKELDKIVKIINPNIFLVLNNSYEDLNKLLNYTELTIIILNDFIKSKLVLNLPNSTQKFNIDLEDYDKVDINNELDFNYFKKSLGQQVEEIIKILKL